MESNEKIILERVLQWAVKQAYPALRRAYKEAYHRDNCVCGPADEILDSCTCFLSDVEIALMATPKDLFRAMSGEQLSRYIYEAVEQVAKDYEPGGALDLPGK